ncbi:MAG: hypothetical protein EBZ59_06895 [Planctomycetia bacterium]|nr:hypothetical protein [Planctomycetia bacterium]
MIKRAVCLFAFVVLMTVDDTVFADTLFSLSVDATSNLFGAGHPSVPPSAHGSGTLPPYISLPAGKNRVVMFTTVSGSVSFDTLNSPPQYLGQYNGPDGGAILFQDSGWPNNYLTTSSPPGMLPPSEAGSPTTFYTQIDSLDGISGLTLFETAPADRRAMFLAGVFTSDSEPNDPAPAILDFSSTAIGTSFTSLSPLLHQSFFIGDGLAGTGSGTAQSFIVPDAATRLYLGFVDGQCFVGHPDYYDNNSGAFAVQGMTMTVPEIDPAGFGSIAAILTGVFGLLERRRLKTNPAA